MDYLKSIGIHDKVSYKHWVIKNHPDRNKDGTELFIKVRKMCSKLFTEEFPTQTPQSETGTSVFGNKEAYLLSRLIGVNHCLKQNKLFDEDCNCSNC